MTSDLYVVVGYTATVGVVVFILVFHYHVASRPGERPVSRGERFRCDCFSNFTTESSRRHISSFLVQVFSMAEVKLKSAEIEGISSSGSCFRQGWSGIPFHVIQALRAVVCQINGRSPIFYRYIYSDQWLFAATLWAFSFPLADNDFARLVLEHNPPL